MNNAEQIAEWIKDAHVEKYENDNKSVIIASNENQYLILTCDRVYYTQYDKSFPHVNLIWLEDGESLVLLQDILREGHNIHSIGNLTGEWGSRENLETVWCALVKKLPEHWPTKGLEIIVN